MLGLKDLRNCFAKLSNKSLLRVKGPESSSFLQGLISNQIYNLEGLKDPKKTFSSLNLKSLYSGLFTSQGRIFCEVFLYREPSSDMNSILIECDSNLKEQVVNHLKKFKIRVKADILDASTDYNVWTCFGKEVQTHQFNEKGGGSMVVVRDPRGVSSLGWKIIAPSNLQPEFPGTWSCVNSSVYEYYRVLHGVPEGSADFIANHSLPFETTLDYLNAISFDKGCYLGQELTNRTRHSGVTRKRLFPFVKLSTSTLSQNYPLISMDTCTQREHLIPSVLFDEKYNSPISVNAENSVVTLDGKKTGSVHSTILNAGMAMVRLEHVNHSNIENTIFQVTEGKDESQTPAQYIQLIKPHWWDAYLNEREQKEKENNPV